MKITNDLITQLTQIKSDLSTHQLEKLDSLYQDYFDGLWSHEYGWHIQIKDCMERVGCPKYVAFSLAQLINNPTIKELYKGDNHD